MEFETKIFTIGYDTIIEASEALKQGEIIAIPTETVYGLAANALDDNAIKKILMQRVVLPTTL